MDLRRVKQVNYLENTVLLYRGTKEMHSQYNRGQRVSHGEDDSQLLWTDYKNFVSELEKDSSIIKNTQNRTEQWRFQNGLTDFFKFLQDELQLTRNSVEQEDVCNWAAKLLCLFDAVKSIENCAETFPIPYLFEHLCNGMRDIMGSDMCYLTYYSDGNFTPLATSSFKRDILDYALGESDYIQLLGKWELEEKKR